MFGVLSSLAVVKAAPIKPEEVASACAACGTFILLIPIVVIALHVFFMIWVAKDCKARGQREFVGWLILIALTGVVGLIVYLCARPVGQMVLCEKCKRRHFQSLAVCPHCGT